MSSILSPYSNNAYKVEYEEGDVSLERITNPELSDSGLRVTLLEGQTLQELSFLYYGDSGRWGDIASINEIDDPFNLPVGSSIILPV